MLALTLTADLTGVTDLQPVDTTEEPYFYTFKVQCTSCREIHPNWVSISRFVSQHWDGHYHLSLIAVEQEINEMSGSRGEANFVWRCKSCKRESTASIKNAPILYAQSSPPKKTKIIEIDCRGLELTDFKSEGEWMAKGSDSGTKFSGVDLQEGEWFDYDEKAGDEVSIKDIEWAIIRA